MVTALSHILSVLNDGARASPRGRSNYGAFLAADQCAANCTHCAADERAFGLAVMMSVRASMRGAFGRRAQDYETDRQKHRQNVLVVYTSYHFRTSTL